MRRHQNRHIGVAQRLLGDAAKHPFAPSPMGVSANDQKRPGDLRSFVQKRLADGVEFQSDPRRLHAQPMRARYPAIAASDGSSLSSSATESRTMQLALARNGSAAVTARTDSTLSFQATTIVSPNRLDAS